MIKYIKWIKVHFRFLWTIIQFVNSCLVDMLYGNRIKDSVRKFLPYTDAHHYIYRQAQQSDIDALVLLMQQQPAGFDTYFKPHAFDLKGFANVLNDKSFYAFVTLDNEKIIGYSFIRFFFDQKAFRGKMVDYRYQGQGIAKQMGMLMTNIAFGAKYRLFATISSHNVQSLASSKAVNTIKILKELDDDYYYIEYLSK